MWVFLHCDDIRQLKVVMIWRDCRHCGIVGILISDWRTEFLPCDWWMWGIFCGILGVLQNIIMDLNNVKLFQVVTEDVFNWERGHGLIHDIIKRCVFVHVGLEDIIMGCPNLVQGDSNYVWICTMLGHPMVIFEGPTWTNAHYLILLCCLGQREDYKHKSRIGKFETMWTSQPRECDS